MEKKKRHYPLELVKELISNGNWTVTQTGLKNALDNFNFRQSAIKTTILNMNAHDFYKSMTDYGNHTSWQDVYRPMLKGVMAYIKISIVEDKTVVIQFKRK